MPESPESSKARGHPTLQDVADAAGISVMSVSRCLRNDPRHSEETRLRVRAIAERLGYRPNPLAAAFVATREKNREKKRSSTIAYIRRLGEQHPNQQDLRDGIFSRTERQGLGVDELAFEPGDEQRLQRVLRARGILGVIFGPFRGPHVRLDSERIGVYQGWTEQGQLAVDTVWGAMVTNRFQHPARPHSHQVAPQWHCGEAIRTF